MAVLLGSKNLSVIEEVVLTESQTYTARRTGIADVICIGGVVKEVLLGKQVRVYIMSREEVLVGTRVKEYQ